MDQGPAVTEVSHIRFVPCVLLCLALLLPLPAAADTGSELKKISQELLDAITAGDPSVWERHLAETCARQSVR